MAPWFLGSFSITMLVNGTLFTVASIFWRLSQNDCVDHMPPFELHGICSDWSLSRP